MSTDFVVLVFSMSIVLVMGTNTTSIDIALVGSGLTELWVTKVTGFSSQFNTGRYVSYSHKYTELDVCLVRYFFTQLVS